MEERDIRFRKQLNPNQKCLNYPYSYLKEYDLTPSMMFNEPAEELIDFPNCVTNYYWIYEGINDEVPWRALFEYKDKNNKIRYGFYIGECDYTGFDCQGSMKLYISDKINILINKAFTDEDYDLYINQTYVDI